MEDVEVIGICRKSRGKQDLQRQIRNILKEYPNARIIQITHCGATVIGYKEFEKVMRLKTIGKVKSIN